MKNPRKEKLLPVAGPRPNDFPLYSLESRAAARAIVERKGKKKRLLVVQFVSPNGDITDGPTFEVDE